MSGWKCLKLICRYVRFGSFVEDTSSFDAAAFRLASGEAVALDPQARIALEQTQVLLLQGCTLKRSEC